MTLAANFQSHLDAMFLATHTAKLAVWGANPATGVLFAAGSGDPFADGQAQTNTWHIIYPTAKFVGLRGGNSITVDGIAYTVIEVRLVDDGETSLATLSTVT